MSLQEVELSQHSIADLHRMVEALRKSTAETEQATLDTLIGELESRETMVKGQLNRWKQKSASQRATRLAILQAREFSVPIDAEITALQRLREPN